MDKPNEGPVQELLKIADELNELEISETTKTCIMMALSEQAQAAKAFLKATGALGIGVTLEQSPDKAKLIDVTARLLRATQDVLDDKITRTIAGLDTPSDELAVLQGIIGDIDEMRKGPGFTAEKAMRMAAEKLHPGDKEAQDAMLKDLFDVKGKLGIDRLEHNDKFKHI